MMDANGGENWVLVKIVTTFEQCWPYLLSYLTVKPFESSAFSASTNERLQARMCVIKVRVGTGQYCK